MGKQYKQRAKNLCDEDINTIVGMLDGWIGELTWNKLIDAIKAWQFSGICYSRQALHLHEPIRLAYKRNKKRLREAEITRRNEMIKLIRAEASGLLDAENARLKAENEHFLRQFNTSVSESMARCCSPN